jgi:beta-catenin-like protein 1
MRSKYVGDPTKFVTFPRSVSRTTLTRVFTFRYLESEDELDKAFSFLYPLPQNPLLYYPEILKNELLLPALIQLLSHDNTDISLQVISALYEMTDEDVGEDMMEAEEEEGKKEEMGRRLRMIMGDLIEKLVSPACIVI